MSYPNKAKARGKRREEVNDDWILECKIAKRSLETCENPQLAETREKRGLCPKCRKRLAKGDTAEGGRKSKASHRRGHSKLDKGKGKATDPSSSSSTSTYEVSDGEDDYSFGDEVEREAHPAQGEAGPSGSGSRGR